MKTILTTLNAKYIHTSLALRLLYVANRDKFDISFQEYVIKERVESVATSLLSTNADVIGIGVYIWNVEQTRRLIELLKASKPELIIIVGGPEVTYEPQYFIDNWQIDFVISGEGEFVLGDLLTAIRDGKPTEMDGVSSPLFVSEVVVKADLAEIAKLPSPYTLDCDKGEMKNRIVYFETSRGCPYRCQYCLSSLEKGVRYFPQEYIFENLNYFIESDAKQIKFLDRTFNLNKEHTFAIFDFLIQHHRPNLSCQFEVYADLLSDEIINYLNENLPDNYFRFEIGIQSTHEPTNIAVDRKQDFPLLANNIRKLMAGGKIDLHLDLIAGLPYETLERFVQSFDEVFALKGKEIQLGFLKMLRGTNLRKNAAQYGYKYDQQAPYEIECNKDISKAELGRIHRAEMALDKYWNSGKFGRTMQRLVEEHYKGHYFALFDEMGEFFDAEEYPRHGYQLEDTFRNLHAFLESRNIDLFTLLRTDYYSNFKVRPHGFWADRLEKKERKQILYLIGQDKAFLAKHNLTRKIVEKQATLDPIANKEYLLSIFFPTNRLELVYKIENITLNI